MEMQPKKKKGKGCLIAIGVFFGIAILVGVLSNLGTKMVTEKTADGKTVIKAEEQEDKKDIYLQNLKDNKDTILDKIAIEKDDVENVAFYYDKKSPANEQTNGVFLLFSEKNDVFGSLHAYFQYCGKESIMFDTVIFNVDGTAYTIDLDLSNMMDKGHDLNNNFEFYERANKKLKGDLQKVMFSIPNAQKVIVRFKGKNITQKHFDYEMTAEDKQAIRNITEAHQLLTEKFVYDFDSAE